VRPGRGRGPGGRRAGALRDAAAAGGCRRDRRLPQGRSHDQTRRLCLLKRATGRGRLLKRATRRGRLLRQATRRGCLQSQPANNRGRPKAAAPSRPPTAAACLKPPTRRRDLADALADEEAVVQRVELLALRKLVARAHQRDQWHLAAAAAAACARAREGGRAAGGTRGWGRGEGGARPAPRCAARGWCMPWGLGGSPRARCSGDRAAAIACNGACRPAASGRPAARTLRRAVPLSNCRSFKMVSSVLRMALLALNTCVWGEQGVMGR
jgi:hypothetical protein